MSDDDVWWSWWSLSLEYLTTAVDLLQGNHHLDGERNVPLRPAIYCLRHGRELLLKSIHLLAESETVWTHDQQEIRARIGDVEPPSEALQALLEVDRIVGRSALGEDAAREAITRHTSDLIEAISTESDLPELDMPHDVANTSMRYPDPAVAEWLSRVTHEDIASLAEAASDTYIQAMAFGVNYRREFGEAMLEAVKEQPPHE